MFRADDAYEKTGFGPEGAFEKHGFGVDDAPNKWIWRPKAPPKKSNVASKASRKNGFGATGAHGTND